VPVVEPLFSELQHFVDCIVEGRQPQVTPAAGLNALRLALQIREMCQKNVVTRIPQHAYEHSSLTPIPSQVA